MYGEPNSGLGGAYERKVEASKRLQVPITSSADKVVKPLEVGAIGSLRKETREKQKKLRHQRNEQMFKSIPKRKDDN